MRLVLLGPPGAGKGTQAYRLATRYDIPLISTGDIFRRNVEEDTELGREARQYMEAGELVPDDVVVKMVSQALDDAPGDGFVLDGFPRTIPQAEMLRDDLVRRERPLTAALLFVIEDELTVKRIAGRRTCAVCQRPYNVELRPPKVDNVCDRCGGRLIQREDDREDTVRHRLEVYHRSTEPLVEFYDRVGLLERVDANGTEDEVSDRAAGVLSARRSKDPADA